MSVFFRQGGERYLEELGGGYIMFVNLGWFCKLRIMVCNLMLTLLKLKCNFIQNSVLINTSGNSMFEQQYVHSSFLGDFLSVASPVWQFSNF